MASQGSPAPHTEPPGEKKREEKTPPPTNKQKLSLFVFKNVRIPVKGPRLSNAADKETGRQNIATMFPVQYKKKVKMICL